MASITITVEAENTRAVVKALHDLLPPTVVNNYVSPSNEDMDDLAYLITGEAPQESTKTKQAKKD